MKFFKPTPAKIIIALILTLWPYVASWFYVSAHSEGDGFSDNLVQYAFFYHAWAWSPLYLILHSFSKPLLNILWQSGFFIFFVYPLLRFILRYIAACVFVFLTNKFFMKHSKKSSTEVA